MGRRQQGVPPSFHLNVQVCVSKHRSRWAEGPLQRCARPPPSTDAHIHAYSGAHDGRSDCRRSRSRFRLALEHAMEALASRSPNFTRRRSETCENCTRQTFPRRPRKTASHRLCAMTPVAPPQSKRPQRGHRHCCSIVPSSVYVTPVDAIGRALRGLGTHRESTAQWIS